MRNPDSSTSPFNAMNNENPFRIIKTCPDTKARAGELETLHGIIPTPVFTPVGSQGTVKTLTPVEIKEIGLPMILANTYHLHLRPGIETVEKAGGLHKFMAWDGAILTDSGGYQIFSLSRLRQITDEGVVFRSHLDGSEHRITPELAIQYQESLGADITMVLDECASYDEDYKKVRRAMERTNHWAERCLAAWKGKGQLLYAIVQGGVYSELRRQSAGYLTSMNFPGYAIGGLSIGETKDVTYAMIDETVALLPENKPRYLMGVGSPEDLLEGISRGIDIFDCVLPTRIARNGSLFTRSGRINIRNASFSKMMRPINDDCSCYTCRTYTAAYMHHLFHAKELLGYRLATIHNLTFINNLIKEIRGAILDGSFDSFKKKFLSDYKVTDEQIRLGQKQKWLESRGT